MDFSWTEVQLKCKQAVASRIGDMRVRLETVWRLYEVAWLGYPARDHRPLVGSLG